MIDSKALTAGITSLFKSERENSKPSGPNGPNLNSMLPPLQQSEHIKGTVTRIRVAAAISVR